MICFTADAEDISQYLQAGDTHYDDGEPQAALDEYNRALDHTGSDYELLWRLSRCYRKLGAVAGKKKELIANTGKAGDYARKAIEADPDRYEGHLCLADALARLVAHAPFSKVYKFILEIKSSADKVLELKPDSDRAYLILGVWHRKIARTTWIQKTLIKAFWGNVPEASLGASILLLKKAVELDSTKIRHHYELARSYDENGESFSAEASFRAALQCVPQNKWDEEALRKSEKYLKRSR